MIECLSRCLFEGLLNIVYNKKMSEQGEQDKCIKCQGCKCKYINAVEHIKQDFGYNWLG